MSLKKWYAVKRGRTPGVFETWEEAKQSVSGYSGAVFKSFPSLEEAQAYVDSATVQVATHIPGEKETPPAGECWAFVDGSYDQRQHRYGYGGVMIYPEHLETFYGGSNQEGLVQMRNVSGEMSAAMRAVQKASRKGCQKITLFYDYKGIEEWATGGWQANADYTQQYAHYMQQMAQKIQIVYVKVPAHTGIYYNEIADQLAKKGVSETH